MHGPYQKRGPTIMKVACYIRVSSDEQADSGLSLAHQKKKLELLAEVQDWTIVDLIEDAGLSAGSMNREGLQEILGLVRSRKIEGVLVFKLDRLTRSLRDLLSLMDEFKRYKVRLVSASENLDTSTAAGRFFIQMLGSISEWEKAAIGERTGAAISQLRSNGKRFSRFAPYGWRYRSNGEMVPSDAEQETIKVMKQLRQDGLSLAKIGTALVDEGRRPRNGKRSWSTTLIRRVLQSQ